MIGALLKKNTTQVAADYRAETNVSWGAVEYSTRDGTWSAGSPTKLTIPSAWNGYRMVFTSCILLDELSSGQGHAYVHLKKNGSADFIGWAGSECSSIDGWFTISDNDGVIQFMSHPQLVATGDEFEVGLRVAGSDGEINVLGGSTFGCFARESGVTGKVLCKLNSDRTTANYSTRAALDFDGADVYDTDGAHDPSSNNTKIIVPSAWNGLFGVFTGRVRTALHTVDTQVSLSVRKNGSDVWVGAGGMSYQQRNSGFIGTAYTQAVQLATGEQYELMFMSEDTSVTVLSDTSFGCHLVGSDNEG